MQGQRDGHGIETTGAFKKRMVYKDGYLVATTPMASEKVRLLKQEFPLKMPFLHEPGYRVCTCTVTGCEDGR